jgi:hypothetical protein
MVNICARLLGVTSGGLRAGTLQWLVSEERGPGQTDANRDGGVM